MTGLWHRVEVTDQAYEAIRSHVHYIAFEQKALLNAKRWLEGLWDAIDSLEKLPKRCRLAPENNYRSYEIRQLDYGDYAILFTIDDDRQLVYVVGFRHGKQLPRANLLPDEPRSNPK
ncbi:MAG: type II toxin-antitoxin system RelE/ParE family toxin [Candidatus Omnitrophota bacterium]